MILRRSLRKWRKEVWLDSSGLGQGPVAGRAEYSFGVATGREVRE
jgi:hypothetical protein